MPRVGGSNLSLSSFCAYDFTCSRHNFVDVSLLSKTMHDACGSEGYKNKKGTPAEEEGPAGESGKKECEKGTAIDMVRKYKEYCCHEIRTTNTEKQRIQ